MDALTCCIPITSLTQSRLEIMFNRTSGHSSFSCDKKRGSKCSIVLCLPSMGLRPIMTDASADLTCWLGSATNSFTNGRIFVMMIDSCWYESKFWQKSRTLCAAAARTSASVSFNSDWNAGTRSDFVISWPTAFWS